MLRPEYRWFSSDSSKLLSIPITLSNLPPCDDTYLVLHVQPYNTIIIDERYYGILALGRLFYCCRTQYPELNDLIWPLDNNGDGGEGCGDPPYHTSRRGAYLVEKEEL
jgi:hypothetical protein